jgi:DNA polymerase-3 subunit beta
MKIKAPKPIIESILVNIQPFLERKDATQITSHVFFQTTPDGCIVKATDGEIGLRIQTDQIIVESEGSFTANGKKLLDIVRILKEGDITLEVLQDNLLIKQAHSKFKLPTFDPSAFPVFPQSEGKAQITLDSYELIRNLKKISPAIDTNNPKYELNGALINIKTNGTDLVGTDTRRLAVATIQSEQSEPLQLIVPKKAIMEIQKLFLDEITINYDETNLIIQNEHYFFFTRLINGKFPDYERIIPQSVKHDIELPKKAMLDAIKMITTISHDIKMTLMNDHIVFNSLSADNVEAKTEIEVQTGLTDKIEVAFNSRYLLDFIAQVEGERFSLGINEPTLPFIVKENNFMTIIMPIVA